MMAALPAPALALDAVAASYGTVRALNGISAEVYDRECVAVIGPNGAGKSTLAGTISGHLPVQSGRIRFLGKDITSWDAAKRVRLGIAHVPEGRHVFNELTVEENLRVGASVHRKLSRVERSEILAPVYDIFPILADRGSQNAGTLSGGEQQMLVIARGLMSRPRLMILDEPSLGLAPLAIEKLMALLRSLRDTGLTMLLVEQNASLAMNVADRVYVVESGRAVAAGTPQELERDDTVRRIYMGIHE